jgi:hypothetical protein
METNVIKTILQLRREAIQKIINDEVKAYIKFIFNPKHKELEFLRHCASCGKEFVIRMRWHFFCSAECRKEFYRGQFKPRD